MRTLECAVALFSLVLASAPAPGEPPPPGPTTAAAPQHVVIPSLPGQRNLEGTVTPSGALPTDSEGYARTTTYGADQPIPGTSPGGAKSAQGSPAPVVPPLPPPPPVGPAPTGKAVATGANVANIRGTLKAIDPGKSATVNVKGTGRDVTYTLAPGATVPADLKPGESVRVRVQLAEKGKVADRIERLGPPTPATPKK